jgi:[protein-PII] uridylyltransferase
MKTAFKELIKHINETDNLSLSDIHTLQQQEKALLQQHFANNADIQSLLKQHSLYIDALLCKLWRQLPLNKNCSIAIIAVGGYGRQEMHPHSDIDLLILLGHSLEPHHEVAISDFITQLWDLKFEIGQSVRTLEECLTEAENDLSIITNLIESRFLCGQKKLFNVLKQNITPDKFWDSPSFFQAKLEEQQQRYKRYGDTSYRVEPNLKEGPGGLRDIHMITWVTKREYDTLSLRELYDEELITQREYNGLIKARNFLWKVRFGLHLLANRKEDRLLLDYQRSLAHQFGYPSSEKDNSTVEKFMHDYFHTITRLGRLNELLIGIYREHILPLAAGQVQPINNWCEQQGNYLVVKRNTIFTEQPHTLLEIFHLLQTHPDIKGLAPQTTRLIHTHLPMIDDDYRHHPQHKDLFIKIMSESRGISYVLRRMSRYGILGRWIPAFGKITGLMQFDLFHAYTVDDHTLRLISNLRKYSNKASDTGSMEFSRCHAIFNTLPDPKLLYLAGLFHDIAKGRGGNHSELGAEYAYSFCRSHCLDTYSSSIVRWVIENHLLMSMTAQRKDVSDPEVIKIFAAQIVDPARLDYLYLLTIADIKATNPELWNGWKHSLLSALYQATHNLLTHGMPPASYVTLIEQKRESVLEQLPTHNISKKGGQQYCDSMGNDYLQHHCVKSILWQMTHIKNDNVYPIIQLRSNPSANTTFLFIYTPEKNHLFAKTTSVLQRLNYPVVAAYIMTTPNNFGLETLNLLNTNDTSLSTSNDHTRLINTLRNALTNTKSKPDSINDYRMPRQLKSFKQKTRITIEQDQEKQQTHLMLQTLDVPGVLSTLAKILADFKLQLISARISTLGEEAEDSFFLTTHDGKAVTDEKMLSHLQEAIYKKLNP